MMRKFFPALAALLLFAALTTVAGAEAAEQRAFALKDPVTLYAKPDESAKSWEVSLPDEGVKVPSAIRDKDDALWYKVTVDGRTGWLFNEGIRLLMGGKSRVAESVYKRCAGVRSRVMKKPGNAWQEGATTDETDGTLVTYTTEGGAFQALKTGDGVEDVYFCANGSEACKTFLGFDPIKMHKDKLRTKVGTPTVRETPDGERDVSILSYELGNRKMTMAFHLRNDHVEWFELYRGRTGEASEGWSSEAIQAREEARGE